MTEARAWVERLGLRRHPEGGYFRETYRSDEGIARDHLPTRFGGDRAFSTAIYFLLEGEDFSALHTIQQDEVWHFYEGSPLTIHVVDPDGTHAALRLGRNVAAGEEPQAVVRAGRLFGALVNDPASFALVGCTVAPGFDFADFEVPTRASLLARYPQHRGLIEQLTRG
jgi:predicted cupin superfamily sugar epimerase